MDALKEHRLLLTLIGGVVMSIVVYMFVAAPARETASQELMLIDREETTRVARVVRDSPTAGEIRLRQAQRHEALRELYESYRVYLEWGRPLLTFRVPDVDEDPPERFRAHLSLYLDEMQATYVGTGGESFRNPIPRDEPRSASGDEEFIETPFAFAEGRAMGLPRPERSEEIVLSRKQFWVMFELMQIMRDSIRESQARGEGAGDNGETAPREMPYFQIESLTFPRPTRQDPSGLYQGIPFEMRLHASIELWPRILYALHQSPRDDSLTFEELQRIHRDHGVSGVINLGSSLDRPGGSSRIGLRFDRVRTNVRTGPINDSFSVRLDNNEVAQRLIEQYFPENWNEEGRRLIPPSLPRETIDRIERLPSDERGAAMANAISDNQQAFLDHVIARLYDRLRDALGPKPSHLTLTIEGEAVDYLHNPQSEAVRFWDRLVLSTDDVVEMLKRGVNTDLGDDRETWPTCDFFPDERTNFNPVYVPYAMNVRIENNTRRLDPYTPYRLSEKGLRLVAEVVRPSPDDGDIQ